MKCKTEGAAERERRLVRLRRLLICMGFTLLCNWLAYYGTRYLTTGLFHYDLTGFIENGIPFLPWTILIYWGCYLYWGTNYLLGGLQTEKDVYRFFSADFLAKCVCLVTFLVFPTTNIRPAVEGEGIFEELMRLLYRMDPADNLFPSIHCLVSWFCFLAVRRQERIPKWYKCFSFVCTVLICLSTLTTKQHVIWDVIGGIALAESSFWLTQKTGFENLYGRWVRKIEKCLDRKAEGRGHTVLSGCHSIDHKNADGGEV